MKTIVIMLTLLSSLTVFAGGKLILKPAIISDSGDMEFMAGISVYQPIFSGIAYSGFAGTGTQTLADIGAVDNRSTSWISTHHAVVLNFGRTEVSPGLGYQSSISVVNPETFVDLKLSYKLW